MWKKGKLLHCLSRRRAPDCRRRRFSSSSSSLQRLCVVLLIDFAMTHLCSCSLPPFLPLALTSLPVFRSSSSRSACVGPGRPNARARLPQWDGESRCFKSWLLIYSFFIGLHVCLSLLSHKCENSLHLSQYALIGPHHSPHATHARARANEAKD
jgi:hypothetical protein